MILIDLVTDLLEDGKWHYVRTLARELDQPESRVRTILRFCSDFGIAAFDQTGNKVKIYENFRKLIS
jgi:hypothetical protein